MNVRKLSLFMILTAIPFLHGCDKKQDTDPNAPEACFSLPEEAYAGIGVTFNSGCSVNGTTFTWEFGDGGSSTEAVPSHVYQSEGSYKVTLTVTNSDGTSAAITQTLVVTAPAVMEHRGYIREDETWVEGIHLVTGDVYVQGATLTIEPGAVIRFSEGTSLTIGLNSDNSKLLANGTIVKPIIFTSNAAVPAPGDWDRIYFQGGNLSTSSMKYCSFEYGGGYGTGSGMIEITSTSLVIEKCTLSNSAALGINLSMNAFFESFQDNIITSTADYAVRLFPDAVHTLGKGNYINGTKGINIKGGNFTLDNATWLKQSVPYTIEGNIYVGNPTESILTLSPGLELDFKENASLLVGYGGSDKGALVAEGIASQPILFTSAGDVKTPGSWDRIGFFSGTTSNTSLAFCKFEYGGGYGPTEGMVVLEDCTVPFIYCEFSHSMNYGIRVAINASFKSFLNNTFENNALYAIRIFANHVHTIGSGNLIDASSGILVNSDTYNQADETWLKQTCPYVIDGIVYVESSNTARLTIEPGTTIRFNENSGIWIGYRTDTYGELVANGTTGEKITFTTNATAGNEAPGQWEGLFFRNGTVDGSVLNYCDFSYGGGYSSSSGMVNCDNTPDGLPAITNCSFSNSGAWAIYISPLANPQMNNNTFANNTLGDVKKN